MGIWLCSDCGCVAIRTGFVQIEIDYEDALEIMVPLCQKLIAMYKAGGPPRLLPEPHNHEEPEDLGEEEDTT
jgi:hypothetical protein